MEHHHILDWVEPFMTDKDVIFLPIGENQFAAGERTGGRDGGNADDALPKSEFCRCKNGLSLIQSLFLFVITILEEGAFVFEDDFFGFVVLHPFARILIPIIQDAKFEVRILGMEMKVFTIFDIESAGIAV